MTESDMLDSDKRGRDRLGVGLKWIFINLEKVCSPHLHNCLTFVTTFTEANENQHINLSWLHPDVDHTQILMESMQRFLSYVGTTLT